MTDHYDSGYVRNDRPLFRTPEAIREEEDRRAEAVTQGWSKTPGRKRPITVYVSGERGSGKTTLISVVAKALERSDHLVEVPRGTPNATTAVLDLREQFDVKFVETDVNVATPEYDEARKRLADVEFMNARLKAEASQLRAAIDEQRGTIAGLTSQLACAKGEIATLVSRLPKVTPDVIAQQIEMAIEEIRQSAVLDNRREQLIRQRDEFAAHAAKLRVEADGRTRNARQRLRHFLMGPGASEPPVGDQPEPSNVIRSDAKATDYVVGHVGGVGGSTPAAIAQAGGGQGGGYAVHVVGRKEPVILRRAEPRTLFQQAQDVYAGTREAVATDRLAQANLASMTAGDEDVGC